MNDECEECGSPYALENGPYAGLCGECAHGAHSYDRAEDNEVLRAEGGSNA
jgi:hypothetical protein